MNIICIALMLASSVIHGMEKTVTHKGRKIVRTGTSAGPRFDYIPEKLTPAQQAEERAKLEQFRNATSVGTLYKRIFNELDQKIVQLEFMQNNDLPKKKATIDRFVDVFSAQPFKSNELFGHRTMRELSTEIIKECFTHHINIVCDKKELSTQEYLTSYLQIAIRLTKKEKSEIEPATEMD